MPSKTNPFTERAPFIRACSEAMAIVRQLQAAAELPTKAFNRQLAQHRQQWLELSSVAEAQAQRTSEPTVRRAARRARPTSGGNDNGNDANTSVSIKAAPIAMAAP